MLTAVDMTGETREDSEVDAREERVRRREGETRYRQRETGRTPVFIHNPLSRASGAADALGAAAGVSSHGTHTDL